jgi:hypothetical protein
VWQLPYRHLHDGSVRKNRLIVENSYRLHMATLAIINDGVNNHI